MCHGKKNNRKRGSSLGDGSRLEHLDSGDWAGDSVDGSR